jgi:hypothetical protein
MALPTKTLGVSEEKVLPLRGMGFMAVQTTHLIN